MSHAEYIRNKLEKMLIEKPCPAKAKQGSVIYDTIGRYWRHQYTEIDSLFGDARKQMVILRALEHKTTAKQFAINTGYCISTSRRKLYAMPEVECDKSSRPYIFSMVDEPVDAFPDDCAIQPGDF